MKMDHFLFLHIHEDSRTNGIVMDVHELWTRTYINYSWMFMDNALLFQQRIRPWLSCSRTIVDYLQFSTCIVLTMRSVSQLWAFKWRFSSNINHFFVRTASGFRHNTIGTYSSVTLLGCSRHWLANQILSFHSIDQLLLWTPAVSQYWVMSKSFDN